MEWKQDSRRVRVRRIHQGTALERWLAEFGYHTLRVPVETASARRVDDAVRLLREKLSGSEQELADTALREMALR